MSWLLLVDLTRVWALSSVGIRGGSVHGAADGSLFRFFVVVFF